MENQKLLANVDRDSPPSRMIRTVRYAVRRIRNNLSQGEKNEPNSQELAEALRANLSGANCDMIAQQTTIQDALKSAVTYLQSTTDTIVGYPRDFAPRNVILSKGFIPPPDDE